MRTTRLGVLAAVLGLAACSAPAPAPDRGPRVELDPRTSMRVHFIDVGLGDAILFEFPCAAMLVDLGAEVNEQFDGVVSLRTYLTRFFERRTDLERTLALVVVTQPKLEHVRGASFLMAANSPFKVSNLVTNGQESSSGAEQVRLLHLWAEAEQIPVERVTLGDVPPLQGLTSPIIDPIRCPAVDPAIRVLYSGPDYHPVDWEKRDYENMSNRGLVVRVDFGETSVLLLADLEKVGRSVLQSSTAGSGLLDVDILKVGHHGSWSGTTGELLQEISPEMAVITVGPSGRRAPGSAWALGFPNRDAVTRLLRAVRGKREAPIEVPVGTRPEEFEPMVIDRAVYATAWDGTVVLEAGLKGKARKAD